MKIMWCGQGTLRGFDIHELLHCKPESPIYCDETQKQFYQMAVDEIMQSSVKLHWRIIKNKTQQYSFAEVKNELYGDASFKCGQLRFIQPVSKAFVYLVYDNLRSDDNVDYPYVRAIYLIR